MRTLSYAGEVQELEAGLGLTGEELARALGVAARTLRRWARDEVVPEPAARERIEDLLFVLRELRKSVKPEVIAKWVRRRVELLDGARPVDLILAGETDRLLVLAEALKTGAIA